MCTLWCVSMCYDCGLNSRFAAVVTFFFPRLARMKHPNKEMNVGILSSSRFFGHDEFLCLVREKECLLTRLLTEAMYWCTVRLEYRRYSEKISAFFNVELKIMAN